MKRSKKEDAEDSQNSSSDDQNEEKSAKEQARKKRRLSLSKHVPSYKKRKTEEESEEEEGDDDESMKKSSKSPKNEDSFGVKRILKEFELFLKERTHSFSSEKKKKSKKSMKDEESSSSSSSFDLTDTASKMKKKLKRKKIESSTDEENDGLDEKQVSRPKKLKKKHVPSEEEKNEKDEDDSDEIEICQSPRKNAKKLEKGTPISKPISLYESPDSEKKEENKLLLELVSKKEERNTQVSARMNKALQFEKHFNASLEKTKAEAEKPKIIEMKADAENSKKTEKAETEKPKKPEMKADAEKPKKPEVQSQAEKNAERAQKLQKLIQEKKERAEEAKKKQKWKFSHSNELLTSPDFVIPTAPNNQPLATKIIDPTSKIPKEKEKEKELEKPSFISSSLKLPTRFTKKIQMENQKQQNSPLGAGQTDFFDKSKLQPPKQTTTEQKTIIEPNPKDSDKSKLQQPKQITEQKTIIESKLQQPKQITEQKTMIESKLQQPKQITEQKTTIESNPKDSDKKLPILPKIIPNQNDTKIKQIDYYLEKIKKEEGNGNPVITNLIDETIDLFMRCAPLNPLKRVSFVQPPPIPQIPQSIAAPQASELPLFIRERISKIGKSSNHDIILVPDTEAIFKDPGFREALHYQRISVGICYKIIQELDEIKESYRKSSEKANQIRSIQRLINTPDANIIFQPVYDVKKGASYVLYEKRILRHIEYVADFILQLRNMSPPSTEIIMISATLSKQVKAKSQNIRYYSTILEFVQHYPHPV